MNDSLESVRQPLDLVPRLLHVGLLVPHQLSEVEWHDGVQHRQHLVSPAHSGAQGKQSIKKCHSF